MRPTAAAGMPAGPAKCWSSTRAYGVQCLPQGTPDDVPRAVRNSTPAAADDGNAREYEQSQRGGFGDGGGGADDAEGEVD
jgi:hypothetical protein